MADSFILPYVCSLLFVIRNACLSQPIPEVQIFENGIPNPQNDTFTTDPHRDIHGWVDQPRHRGTMDIIWTSGFTIFVCTYVILCLNVPAECESTFTLIRRRLWWMAVAIAGPEFVLTAACGQRARAKAGVEIFRESGYSNWTIRHGFFADMGGFVLVPKDYPSFPINNKHLHYLVKNKYIDFPSLTEQELGDRSKVDTMAKIITCVQVSYMIIASIARVKQGLALTTLELSALAIVSCSILTSITWLHKPADVNTPIRLNMEIPLAEILVNAGPVASKPFKQTPLDFLDDLKPSWGLNIQTFMNMPVEPHARPLPRFPNDRLPYLTELQQALLCIACLLYAGVHLAGWNFAYPSRAEQILWRTCSMFLFANTAAFWVLETVAAYWRIRVIQRMFARVLGNSGIVSRKLRTLMKPENEASHVAADNSNSAAEPAEPRELPMPIEFWSIMPLALTYAMARAYLIVEAFAGLRHLEASAYTNVEWSAYLPHL